MSVYLALQNQDAPIPSFREKGIPNLMPGSLDDVQVAIAPSTSNQYIRSFLGSIQSFAKAQISNLVTLVSNEPYNMFRNFRVSRTFEVPTAYFNFDNLTIEQEAQLRGFGLNKQGNTHTYFGSPSDTNLNSIFRIGPTDKRIPPGNVSADGYLAYIYALKGYQVFSSLMLRLADTKGNWVSHVESVEKDDNNVISFETEFQVLGDPTAVVSKDILEWNPELVGSVVGEITAVATKFSDIPGFEGCYVDLKSLSTMPKKSGLFFPYFDGMTTPDKSTLQHVFSRLFFSGLGDTLETSSKVWQRVRKGFRNIAFSSAGRALSHLYTGIHLASIVGKPIFAVLSEGVYSGFVIQGDIEVYLHGVAVQACEWDRLVNELGKLNIHGSALQEIVAIVRSFVVGTNVKYDIDVMSVSTSRGLMNTLSGMAEVDFMAVKDRLDTQITNLAYGDRYAPLSQASIIDALKYIETGDINHISRYPAYLATKLWAEHDRVSIAMGIFGPKAPSLNYASRGKTFVLPGPNAIDGNLAEIEGHRVLQYLPFSGVPVRVAIAQWNSLFNEGKFIVPDGRKGKAEFTNTTLVDVKIGTNPYFIDVYRLIKDKSFSVRNELRGGKRKADGSAGERGKAKRVRQDAQEFADLF